ncbi:hypothetical protein N5A92_23890 [Chelativorans sp. EGI FJ00035]|uniref:Uncharacterized protein n=1 Tax=Chelativorans salis TaxID=2978478 RepID=A0ABT2LU62_9HYPH|nr:hypothetical protein [Chelativorans sp. EGI FJ00035]MCT7378065.1 hypothetical protein [Chelativorans sp. EGI FJ00035]
MPIFCALTLRLGTCQPNGKIGFTLGQIDVSGVRDQLNGQQWIFVPEFREMWNQNPVHDNRDRADTDRARHFPRRPAYSIFNREVLSFDHLCMANQDLRNIRHLVVTRSVPNEELHREALFQGPQAPGDRRFVHSEDARCAGQGSRPMDGEKISEVIPAMVLHCCRLKRQNCRINWRSCCPMVGP